MILPTAPGGTADIAIRIMQQKLGDILGQEVTVEYRSGASGMIGAEAVAKAAPDGYTLLLYTDNFLTIPSFLPKMTFDADKELAPVTTVGNIPMVVAANANAPFSTMKELINAANASPNGLTYGVTGLASANYLVGAWIALATHIKLVPVSYRGGSEAVAGIMAGDIPLGIVGLAAIYPAFTDAGKIKVIALTGERRPSFVPSSWPTLAESGLPILVRCIRSGGNTGCDRYQTGSGDRTGAAGRNRSQAHERCRH